MTENQALLAIGIVVACVLLIGIAASRNASSAGKPVRRIVYRGCGQKIGETNYAVVCESMNAYFVVDNPRPQPDGWLMFDIWSLDHKCQHAVCAEPGRWITCNSSECTLLK